MNSAIAPGSLTESEGACPQQNAGMGHNAWLWWLDILRVSLGGFACMHCARGRQEGIGT